MRQTCNPVGLRPLLEPDDDGAWDTLRVLSAELLTMADEPMAEVKATQLMPITPTSLDLVQRVALRAGTVADGFLSLTSKGDSK